MILDPSLKPLITTSVWFKQSFLAAHGPKPHLFVVDPTLITTYNDSNPAFSTALRRVGRNHTSY